MWKLWWSIIDSQKMQKYIGLNFFEAMDFNRTLYFKSNLTDSVHFENNFKRTTNCPLPRLIWMSLVSRGLTGVIIALWRSLRYSTMEFSWELLIYCYVINVTGQRHTWPMPSLSRRVASTIARAEICLGCWRDRPFLNRTHLVFDEVIPMGRQ